MEIQNEFENTALKKKQIICMAPVALHERWPKWKYQTGAQRQ